MTKDCTPVEYCDRFMEGTPCECFPTAAICQACNKDLSEHFRCHCPWQAMWRGQSGADYRKIDGQWRHFIGPDVRWQSSMAVPPLTSEMLDALAPTRASRASAPPNSELLRQALEALEAAERYGAGNWPTLRAALRAAMGTSPASGETK